MNLFEFEIRVRQLAAQHDRPAGQGDIARSMDLIRRAAQGLSFFQRLKLAWIFFGKETP